MVYTNIYKFCMSSRSGFITLYNKKDHELIPLLVSSKLNITKSTIIGLLACLGNDDIKETWNHLSNIRMLLLK